MPSEEEIISAVRSYNSSQRRADPSTPRFDDLPRELQARTLEFMRRALAVAKSVRTRAEPKPAKKYLKISEVAHRLHVCVATVRNWEEAGRIRSTRHPVTGARLFATADVEILRNGEPLGRRPIMASKSLLAGEERRTQ
jgi:type II secretory pathway component PulJ